MSHPTAELDGLPPWKLRLLERIQNTSAEHARVLHTAFPDHTLGHGSSDIPVQTWRAHLRALEADLDEITTHAMATGIEPYAIRRARDAGQRGERWGDTTRTPPTSSHREDPVRAHMVDGIAGDIWHLEHSAAVFAEYRHRILKGQVPDEPGAYQQLQRNMLAVWERADTTAHAVGLTRDEAAALWNRDRTGWEHLVETTVAGYTDAELLERWRALSWRGIEVEAHRATTNLSVHTPAYERPARPPSVWHMIQHAADVIEDGSDTARHHGLDAAIRATGAPEHAPEWDTGTDSEPEARPNASSGHSPGYDR